MRFHVEQPDIVKQLRTHMAGSAMAMKAVDEIERLRQQLFELGEELETWKDRYHAEKQDHEATMKAWDEERSS
jgi:hypothetical protein